METKKELDLEEIDLDFVVEEGEQKPKKKFAYIFLVGGSALMFLAIIVGVMFLFYVTGHFVINSITVFNPRCDVPTAKVDLSRMHNNIRANLIKHFFAGQEGAIYLRGGDTTYRWDTDVELHFRQESNFWYISGYDQPNATIIVDLSSQTTNLFVPNRSSEYAVWNGKILSPYEIEQQYGIDNVYFHDEFTSVLQNLTHSSANYVIYKLPEQYLPDESQYDVNDSVLRSKLNSARQVKLPDELMLIEQASLVSSFAHTKVMSYVRNNIYEYDVEGVFLDSCFSCGLVEQAYYPIVASGESSAILHYVANDNLMTNGELLLIDSGAETEGYASDVTRTYPVNGVFSDSQAEIYNMVLRVQETLMNMVKPGLTFANFNAATKKLVCDELIENNFLVGCNTECCLSNGLNGLFMPHGVSHSVGLDVHDTTNQYITMEENMVFTIEPGIYFNNALFGPYMATDQGKSAYLNREKISSFLTSHFGGVRIEDVVLVTQDGFRQLSNAPKTIKEIEKVMKK